MIKNLFKRIKSQKGMSGVLVALLLVIVGVGLVAGVNTFMKGAQKTLISDANSTITTTTNSAKAP
jgi:Flp pilus assembly pilin Flp